MTELKIIFADLLSPVPEVYISGIKLDGVNEVNVAYRTATDEAGSGTSSFSVTGFKGDERISYIKVPSSWSTDYEPDVENALDFINTCLNVYKDNRAIADFTYIKDLLEGTLK